MNINMNKLPPGYTLPEVFEGEKPINHPDAIQVVIGDAHRAPEYKVLCASGRYKVIPFSGLIKEKTETTETEPEAPAA